MAASTFRVTLLLMLVQGFAAPPLSAQGNKVVATLPKGFVKVEGAGYHWAGWEKGPARVLSLIPASRVPHQVKVYRGLIVRPDYQARAKAASLTIEAALSDKGVVTTPRFSIPPVPWSYYYGKNRTVVMRKRTIALPSLKAPGGAPIPWSKGVVLPFDKVWYRTTSTTEAICVDLKLYTKRLDNGWYCDADAYRHDRGYGVTRGEYCAYGASKYVTSVYGYYLGSSKPLVVAAAKFPPGFLGFCYVSTLRKPSPITRNCSLFAIPKWWHWNVSGGSRTNAFSFGFVQPSWVGMRFYTQIVGLDRNRNIIVTTGTEVMIGGGTKNLLQPQYNIYSYGNPDLNRGGNRFGRGIFANDTTIFGIY